MRQDAMGDVTKHRIRQGHDAGDVMPNFTDMAMVEVACENSRLLRCI